jgi:hypothetical protein
MRMTNSSPLTIPAELEGVRASSPVGSWTPRLGGSQPYLKPRAAQLLSGELGYYHRFRPGQFLFDE